MFFVNLIYGHFDILRFQYGQIKKVALFQVCAMDVLQLHTARKQDSNTPQTHLGASISLNTTHTLPQGGVNPKCLPLSVFQQFCSFVTKIRTSMLPNKFYKGAIFVNSLHFCCITFYQSFSLIHHGIISFQRLVMVLTKCDQEKYIYVA